MNTSNKIRTSVLVALSVGLVATIVAAALSGHRETSSLLPLLYLVVIAAIAAVFHKGAVGKPLLWLVVVGIAGWVADFAAVRSGVMFGVFEYGNALGAKLAGVPLAMVLLWMLMIYLSLAISAPIEDPVRRNVVGAGSVVLFDLLLEPSASELGIWQFSHNQVPFQNYMVWFALAYIFIRIMKKARDSFSNTIAVPLYWVLMGFLLLLDLTLLMFK